MRSVKIKNISLMQSIGVFYFCLYYGSNSLLCCNRSVS